MSAANNKAFNALPRFIWGEARDDAGLSAHEYLTHTRFPRFVCRIEDVPTLAAQFVATGADTESVQMQIQPDPFGRPAVLTSIGLVFCGFAWVDKQPDEAGLVDVIRAAVADWLAREDEYAQLA